MSVVRPSSLPAPASLHAALAELARPLCSGFGLSRGSFPTPVIRGLARRGVTLSDLADAVLRECCTPDPVEHGDDNLNFLVVVLASHVVEEARATVAAVASSRYLICLHLAHDRGASVEDLAAAVERSAGLWGCRPPGTSDEETP